MKKNTLAFVSFLGILVVIGVAHFLLDRLGAGILSAVLLAAWLLWFVPKWQVDGHAAVIAPEDRPETENEFRRTMVQLVGGAAVLAGLFFTWQQLVATRETLQLAQSGRISDRLSRSIEQLGNVSMHVRLGGLYGLQRVGIESSHDRAVAREILAAFVRTSRTKPPTEAGGCPATERPSAENRCDDLSTGGCEDVRTALNLVTALNKEAADGAAVDLARVDLRSFSLPDVALPGAIFSDACLRRGNFDRADMSGARLNGAELIASSLRNTKLSDANLSFLAIATTDMSGAQLQGSDLTGAEMNQVTLTGANLSKTKLINAILSSVGLKDAVLTGADLRGANLGDVEGLTNDQLQGTTMDDTTILPAYLSGAAR
ncbi:pentapeptide repeat-containing protein [Peristeroidobacter soli]|uniref:pentapeptide repeat-containing protein n=1 Tax=Peristeroidobacter soli TaxID=2497877 RepID=UPI00158E7F2D|nr:pentapeptide repeat-containing protein [Peristeroidobacter soli]